jgi:hypothetical protein
MALDQGSSVDAVKAQLGVPESEFSIGKETILTYVPWRLWFVDDALREKRLERRFRGKRLTGSTLDQGVVGGLKLGSSIEVVKKALGTLGTFLSEGAPRRENEELIRDQSLVHKLECPTLMDTLIYPRFRGVAIL